MNITVLHTADWQIGRQFSNVPGDPGAALRSQRLETVKRIAELAHERQVDLVLVAGDVFEDNAVSDETLRRTINAMAPFPGPWVLLPGNHDSGLTQSAWSRLRQLSVVPENIILADRPDPIDLCQGRVVVLPAPLQRRHEASDLTERFDSLPSDTGVFRVGIAHGSVTNRLPDSAIQHNPIADTRAKTANLDYLALGDWHGTLEVAHRTWYAGTPEPDRFKNNDAGNVLLVVLQEPGAEPRVEKIPVAQYQWESMEFEVVDGQSISLLASQLEALGESERILLNLKLKGAVDLGTRQRLEDLLDDWRARLHFLKVDDTGLLAQPSPEDIAELGATGFVKEAIETLVAIENDADHMEREDAARALQILYLEQRGPQR
jgi:DNA repair exonuclease SbcCD nuclease subunit